MVVPVKRSEETKQYVGNNLFLSFRKNYSKLVVIGNRCSVKIDENFGTVKVIGNDSSVSISKCLGSVEYIGNNGIIHFDRVTSQDQVSYIGNNGSLLCKKAKKQSKSLNKTGKKVLNFNTLVPTAFCSCL